MQIKKQAKVYDVVVIGSGASGGMVVNGTSGVKQ